MRDFNFYAFPVLQVYNNFEPERSKFEQDKKSKGINNWRRYLWVRFKNLVLDFCYFWYKLQVFEDKG